MKHPVCLCAFLLAMGMIKNSFLAIFSITILAIEVKMHFTSFLYLAFFTNYIIVHHSDIATMIINIRVQLSAYLHIFGVLLAAKKFFCENAISPRNTWLKNELCKPCESLTVSMVRCVSRVRCCIAVSRVGILSLLQPNPSVLLSICVNMCVCIR